MEQRIKLLIGLPFGLFFTYAASWLGMRETIRSVWLLLLIWGLGIGFTFYAFVPFKSIQPKLHTNRREWLSVILLIGIGFIIRFIGLNSFPDMMAEDEGYFSWQAAELAKSWNQSPFRYDVHHHPMLYHLIQAMSIDLFGQTVAAARLPSAILGALTIGAVYLAARWMFDKRIAVVSAIFMMTFAQHVHFSRLALNQAMDPLFMALALAFITAALRTKKPVYYAVLGIVIGLSQYGFSSARLIPIVVSLYAIWFYLVEGVQFKREIPLVSISILLLAVTILPQIYFIATNDSYLPESNSFAPRLYTVGVFSETNPSGIHNIPADERLDFWWQQLKQSVLGFFYEKDAGHFYGEFDPFLGWFASLPFIIGVVIALRRWRDGPILVISWALAVILGGVLLNNPPEYQRFVVVIPSMAILVAVGIVYIAESIVWLSRTLTPQQPVPMSAEYWLLPLFLVTILATVNLKIYAIDYRSAHAYFPNTRTERLNLVADHILPALLHYHVLYLPAPDLNLATSPILRYKVPDLKAEEYFGDVTLLPDLLLTDIQRFQQPQAVILAPNHPQVIEAYRVLTETPNLQLQTFVHPIRGTVIVYVFFSID